MVNINWSFRVLERVISPVVRAVWVLKRASLAVGRERGSYILSDGVAFHVQEQVCDPPGTDCCVLRRGPSSPFFGFLF